MHADRRIDGRLAGTGVQRHGDRHGRHRADDDGAGNDGSADHRGQLGRADDDRPADDPEASTEAGAEASSQAGAQAGADARAPAEAVVRACSVHMRPALRGPVPQGRRRRLRLLAGGSGNGPNYVYVTVRVVGSDPFRLDADHDGLGCEEG